MSQKSRVSSQIIDPEAFQLNKNDSCLLGQEQRWALRPFLIVWSPVLEKNCEPVWDLKNNNNQKTPYQCTVIPRVVPGECSVPGETFFELVLVVSGGCACPYSLLRVTEMEGLPEKPRFFSPGSPGLSSIPDRAFLLFTVCTLAFLNIIMKVKLSS